jgi:hypothetical protein
MAYSSQAILAKLIEETVPDLRLKKSVLLDYLSARGCVKKGDHTDLYWNAIASGSQTAVAAMSVAGTDQTTGDAVQAQLAIGGFKLYHQFSVSLVDMQNAKAAGVGRLKNLFKQNISSGLLSIRRQLNTLLWTGDGTAASAGIVGINRILNAPVSVYAGIDPTLYPQWTSIHQTSGTPRALTRNILYDFSRLLEEQEVYHDALFCAPSMAQTYNVLFDNVAGINSVMESTETSTVDLGFHKRAYNGAPLITDPQMPVDRIVGINANDIELISLDLGSADSGQIAALGLRNNLNTISSAEVGGLSVNVALLPQSNPALITFQLFVIVQLKAINRRSVQGILALT